MAQTSAPNLFWKLEYLKYVCFKRLRSSKSSDVEMPSILSLLQMELNGVGFSEEEAERQRKIIVARMADLQTEAFKLAGREFALSSPNEVCKVSFKPGAGF